MTDNGSENLPPVHSIEKKKKKKKPTHQDAFNLHAWTCLPDVLQGSPNLMNPDNSQRQTFASN